MKLLKPLFIVFLIFIGFSNLFSQESKSDFAVSIDSIINDSIQSGFFSGYPMIILQGYPLTDSIQRNTVFEILNVSDIKNYETLSHEKASQLFCANYGGFLLITCNRSGKKKLKKVGLK